MSTETTTLLVKMEPGTGAGGVYAHPKFVLVKQRPPQQNHFLIELSKDTAFMTREDLESYRGWLQGLRPYLVRQRFTPGFIECLVGDLQGIGDEVGARLGVAPR